jgi:predicted Zn-dependent protease
MALAALARCLKLLWLLGAMPALLMVTTATALAQGPAAAAPSGALVAPSEIVLYLHPDLKSTAFVDVLLCALERVLTAPVHVRKLDLALTPDLLASPSQFDIGKVADRFFHATANQGGPTTFKYLLLPYDLKAEPLHYVFSSSFGDGTTPFHIGVVSTARLDVGNPTIAHAEGADVTALRAYKLILKSIARVAGYTTPEGCVLAFPRSLAELDAKSAEFCPEDRAALIAAGILKPEEDGGCELIVEGPRRRDFVFAEMPKG